MPELNLSPTQFTLQIYPVGGSPLNFTMAAGARGPQGEIGLSPKATQADAEIATSNDVFMTPLRTKQQVDFRLASQVEAEARSNNTQIMTPLRTAQEVVTYIKDQDDMASDSAVHVPSQQSVKAFVEGKIIDEDDFASNSATRVPTQQSTKAYIDGADATKQPLDSDLTAIAALATTSYGRSLLTQADAAATRSTIGLGNVDNTSDATKNAAIATLTNKTISGSSNTISNIANASLTNSSMTIAGHVVALGGTQAISNSDIGLGSVTNDAQTKAAIVPNTAPSAGQALVGNAGGTAYAPVTLSGDVSLASTGAATVVSSSETVAGKVELATNAETVTGSDTTRATHSAGVGAAIDDALSHPVTSSGPNWDTYDEAFHIFGVNVGNYPDSCFAAQNTAGTTEAIFGAVDIPSGHPNSSAIHSSGVAGYARTGTNGQGAVGVFGFGMVSEDSCQAWGANFIVTNGPTPGNLGGISPSGKTNFDGWGIEIDISIQKTSGGSAPAGNVQAITIIGNSNTNTTGVNRAVAVYSHGYFESPRIKWDSALYTEDESVELFADIGVSDRGNNHGSQAVRFRSRNSGGTDAVSQIYADADGNFFLIPKSGGSVNMEGSGSVISYLQMKGSSSGAGTLNAPAAASSYGWNLPAASGTLLYDGNIGSTVQAYSSNLATLSGFHISAAQFNSSTSGNASYVTVAHGLGGTPDLAKMFVTAVPVTLSTATPIQAMIVGVDATNTTLQMFMSVAVNGTYDVNVMASL